MWNRPPHRWFGSMGNCLSSQGADDLSLLNESEGASLPGEPPPPYQVRGMGERIKSTSGINISTLRLQLKNRIAGQMHSLTPHYFVKVIKIKKSDAFSTWLSTKLATLLVMLIGSRTQILDFITPLLELTKGSTVSNGSVAVILLM